MQSPGTASARRLMVATCWSSTQSILPRDTAFTLNARCYEAALAGFGEFLDRLDAGNLQGTPQDLSARTYFGTNRRPEGAARLR